MLMYLNLDNTNRRGRVKIAKSNEVFFLSVICKHLLKKQKKLPCVRRFSLLASVLFS